MRVTLSRKAHFNAAHRLYRKDWTFEQNDAVFGKCNNPNFHGHNYELIVSVTGEIDKETVYANGRCIEFVFIGTYDACFIFGLSIDWDLLIWI
jgi:6-pyruvoyl-tetrahydropterin synthase